MKVLALVGVRGSPSCGVTETHITDPVSREPGAGLFFEELMARVDARFLEWDFRDPEGSLVRVLRGLEGLRI